MGSQPPLVLFVLSGLATARAAIELAVRGKKPRRPRRTNRSLTVEELGPLEAPLASFIREASCLQSTAIAIARETAHEAAAPLLAALTACPLHFHDVGYALAAAVLMSLAAVGAWIILLGIVAFLACGSTGYLLYRESRQKARALAAASGASEAAVDSSVDSAVSSETSEASPAVEIYKADIRMAGTWHKVAHLSDSQDPAVQLLRLGGLAKAAMVMFKGMSLRVDSDTMHMRALVKVPLLQVPTEEYDLHGTIRNYKRRDLRRGNFFGYVRVEPEGGVNLYYKWDDPFGGHCCDEMRLRGQDELHVTTHLTVGEAQCSYRVIYWRAGSSGSGMAPQPMTSPLTHLMRSASKVALQMQDALGIVDSRAVAQHALSQGGRKGSAGDLSSDGHISDTSDHGHRGSHERRSSTEGRPPRRVRPFARVEEM